MFSSFETFIPWIALALLGYIGGKMLIEGIRGEEAEEAAQLSAGALFMQGVATSIDALAVGITFACVPVQLFAGTQLLNTVCSVLIIGATTFVISCGGVKIGGIFGTKYKTGAEITGGVILILIGVKILLEQLGVL